MTSATNPAAKTELHIDITEDCFGDPSVNSIHVTGNIVDVLGNDVGLDYEIIDEVLKTDSFPKGKKGDKLNISFMLDSVAFRGVMHWRVGKVDGDFWYLSEIYCDSDLEAVCKFDSTDIDEWIDPDHAHHYIHLDTDQLSSIRINPDLEHDRFMSAAERIAEILKESEMTMKIERGSLSFCGKYEQMTVGSYDIDHRRVFSAIDHAGHQ